MRVVEGRKARAEVKDTKKAAYLFFIFKLIINNLL
jgi:hypothetical protein